MNLEEVQFTKLPIQNTTIMDDLPFVKHQSEWETFRDYTLEGMVVRLRSYVLSEEVENRTKKVDFTYSIPSSWWQHLKKSLPLWLGGRLSSVKYDNHTIAKTVRIRKYATYPRASILFPKETGNTMIYRSFITEERPPQID